MRFQGRITSWKDDKGFGFITPNGGGKQVFVHVSAFRNRQRRPEGDEFVTYELAVDEKGRGQAMQVAFVGEPARGDGKLVPAWLPTFFTVGFLAFLAATVMAGRLPMVVLGVYVVASIAAFLAYGIDKSAAENDRWRTPEKTLHMFGLLGGWPGALAAQRMFRHKSSKPSFQGMFWVTVVLNCCALGWLLTASGGATLRSVLGAA
jgi:uncharacterized membrane protein YsdA (DUF1294 family)/cold shock CspA family protein